MCYLYITYNLPDTTLHPYTTILHSAARLVKSLNPKDHITPALWQLHWLPVEARITFCVLVFNIYSGSSTRYISSLVTPCTKVESRSSLRSSAKCDYIRNPAHVQLIWSTSVRRCWSIRVPEQTIQVSLRHAPSNESFKTKLQTHLS